MAREHGEKVYAEFGVNLPINVCSNADCGMEFILLYSRESGEILEQVANKLSNLYCPYCGKEIVDSEKLNILELMGMEDEQN